MYLHSVPYPVQAQDLAMCLTRSCASTGCGGSPDPVRQILCAQDLVRAISCAGHRIWPISCALDSACRAQRTGYGTTAPDPVHRTGCGSSHIRCTGYDNHIRCTGSDTVRDEASALRSPRPAHEPSAQRTLPTSHARVRGQRSFLSTRCRRRCTDVDPLLISGGPCHLKVESEDKI